MEVHENGCAAFLKFHWRGIFHATSFILLVLFNLIYPQTVSGVMLLHNIMIFWYVADILPAGIVAMLPIVILPLYGVMSSEEVCNSYSMGHSMTFFPSYFISAAFEQTQTSHLMAYKWMSCFSHNPRLLLVTVMFTSWAISTIVPDPIVCCLMLPLSKSIIRILESINIGTLYESDFNFKKRPQPTSLTKAFGVGVAYSTTIGGMATLYGSEVGEIIYTEFQELLPNVTGPVTFSKYLLMGLPFSLALLLCTILFLQIIYLGFLRSYSSNNLKYNNEKCKKALNDVISELPAYSISNIITIASWTILAISCIFLNPLITQSYGGWNDKKINYATICVFICFLLLVLPDSYDFLNYFKCKKPSTFAKPSTILKWNVLRNYLPWNYLLVYGSSSALAISLKKVHYHLQVNDIIGKVNISSARTYYIFESAFSSTMGANHLVAKFFLHTAIRQCLITKCHPGNAVYSIAFGSSISFLFPMSSINNCFACNWFFIRPKTFLLASLGPTFCGIFIAMFIILHILPLIHPEYNNPPYPET